LQMPDVFAEFETAISRDADYGRMSEDSELVDRGTDIRLRAERRAGELLAEKHENHERARGGGHVRKVLQSATLSDLDITKTESSRRQKLAALDDGAFEKRVATGARPTVQ